MRQLTTMKIKTISLKNMSLRSFSLTFFITAIISTAIFTTRTADAQAQSSSPGYNEAVRYVRGFNFESLRLAIEDLTETFGQRYPKGQYYFESLDNLEKSCDFILDSLNRGDNSLRADVIKLTHDLNKFRIDALLSNPLLDFEKLLLFKRKRGQLGLPVNHKCNTGIERTGYDNEIAVLAPVHTDGILQTLFRPPGGLFVGEMDLHFDADSLLFTMPKGKSWQIFEINADSSGLRQVSRGQHQEDVDNFDGCYLPDGRIVFSSTASYTGVPCWHGKERACSIYLMDADGGNMRQLCFDQDLDLHPAVLPTGQVIFSRWDYTGPMHYAYLSTSVDGNESRRHRPTSGLWKQFILAERTLLSTRNTRFTKQNCGYYRRLSRCTANG
ncbi:MAG: TolB family protein [Planctomycetota bacterium]|jgi:hypothetical protein